jgi:hypothetical protein
MNRLILLGFILIIFSGCGKLQDLPTSSVLAAETDTTNILHKVYLSTPTQTVATTVNNNILNLLYTENINVLLTARGYDQSFAVHLVGDFSESALNAFDYTLTTKSGNTTYDWADDNLNDVDQKTVSDTTINGEEMVKINVVRYFKFSKQYATIQAAQQEQIILSNTNGDIINFSSYVFFGQNYPATQIKSKVAYSIVNTNSGN